MTKTCTACQTEKPIEEFPLRRDTANGRRAQCRRCHNARRDRRRGHERGTDYTPRPGGPRLDPGPFRAWLESRLPRYSGVEDMAADLNISARRINGLMRGEYVAVALDTVDRVLLNTDTRLDDLYPLDEQEEV